MVAKTATRRAAAIAAALAFLSGCTSNRSSHGERSAAAGARAAGEGAIDFYQRFLGDQWGAHCNYQPSCSSYSRQAIDQYGLGPGVLMTADRLMRDHQLERASYASDELGRPLDPPADNALFGPRDRGSDADPDLDPATRAREQEELARAPLAADFDESAQLAFADQLFSEREWERARLEYARLLHHRPATTHAARCHQRIALCLAHAGRRNEALAEADRVAPRGEHDLTRALVERELDRPAAALRAAEAAGDPLLAGLLALEADRPDAARAHFAVIDAQVRDELLARTDELAALPRKSGLLAGSLSAVLPGSGQLYAGRPGDGAIAFIINAVLIGGTVAAARNDERTTAVALGVIACGFYTGNIYGAVNAAAKHDRGLRDDLLSRTRGWLRQTGAWISVSPDGRGGALGIYFDL